jgi:Flp pilus assembly protein TadD
MGIKSILLYATLLGLIVGTLTLARHEALPGATNQEQALVSLVAEYKLHPEDMALRTRVKQALVAYCEQEIREGARLIALSPDYLEGYKQAARAYGILGNHFQAMAILTSGVIENPKAIELWMAIADLELKAGRTHEAKSVLDEVSRLTSERAARHNILARAH